MYRTLHCCSITSQKKEFPSLNQINRKYTSPYTFRQLVTGLRGGQTTVQFIGLSEMSLINDRWADTVLNAKREPKKNIKKTAEPFRKRHKRKLGMRGAANRE